MFTKYFEDSLQKLIDLFKKKNKLSDFFFSYSLIILNLLNNLEFFFCLFCISKGTLVDLNI